MFERNSLIERTAWLYYMPVRSSCSSDRVSSIHTRAVYCLCTCVRVMRAFSCPACMNDVPGVHMAIHSHRHPLDVHEMSVNPEGSRCFPKGISPWFKGCAAKIDSTVCQFKHRHGVSIG